MCFKLLQLPSVPLGMLDKSTESCGTFKGTERGGVQQGVCCAVNIIFMVSHAHNLYLLVDLLGSKDETNCGGAYS